MKPVVLPEPFNGEKSWEEWSYHFKNVATVNTWTEEQKLQCLRVRLTGRTQKAFHQPPEASQATYEAAKTALKERFQTRRKEKSEGWADFAEELKSLRHGQKWT